MYFHEINMFKLNSMRVVPVKTESIQQQQRVVVFDGTAPEKTGPKDGTKF